MASIHPIHSGFGSKSVRVPLPLLHFPLFRFVPHRIDPATLQDRSTLTLMYQLHHPPTIYHLVPSTSSLPPFDTFNNPHSFQLELCWVGESIYHRQGHPAPRFDFLSSTFPEFIHLRHAKASRFNPIVYRYLSWFQFMCTLSFHSSSPSSPSLNFLGFGMRYIYTYDTRLTLYLHFL